MLDLGPITFLLSFVSYCSRMLLLNLNLKLMYDLLDLNLKLMYRKVASSNTSRLEAHAGFIRLLMKGIFDPYVL